MKPDPGVVAARVSPRFFLRFDEPATEGSFKNFYTDFYHRFAQASLGLALLLVFGDYLVDLIAHPQAGANIYRLTLCIPLLFAALAYSFHPHAKKHWEVVMSAVVLAIAISLFWVLLQLDGQGEAGLKSWVGILNFSIVELYVFFILGTRFRLSFLTGLLVLIAFEYAMYVGFQGDRGRVAYLSYHAVTMAVISGMLGWWREYLLRQNFAAELAVRRLSEKQQLELSLLEATLNACDIGLMVVDTRGNILTTNNRFATMWRIPAHTLAQQDEKTTLDHVLNQLSDPQDFLATVEDLYRRPEATSKDSVALADGGVFSRYSNPLRLGDQVVGRVWSFLDITEELRSRERVVQLSRAIAAELENSEKHRGQVEALLQAIPDMVWMKGADGVFLSCNAAFEKLIGVPMSEIVGKQDTAVLSVQVADKLLSHDQAAAASQSPLVYEEWVAFPGQQRKVLLETTKVAVRDKEARLIGVLGLARDVTDLRKLVGDLREAKESAQNSNEAKSLFLANMSHEIRTPMNAIIGLSDLALNTPLNARQRNYIQKIKLSSDGLLHIINDILDFSKIEAGKMQLESVHFELDDIFEALSGLMALRAESQGIELAYDVTDRVPSILIGDALRLGQILTNLVSNAIKFSSGGNVLVRVDCLSQDGEQCELQFSVQDEGIGMSSDQLADLFLPFTQADPSTTRRFGGTGLGLAICRRIAGLLGGRIWVESTLGVGSTFHFTARCRLGADRRQQGVRAFAAKLRDFAHRPVLVVDDNPLASKVLQHLIGQLGLPVIAVHSGAAAVEQVRASGCPELLACLVDWHMPGMDGIQTITELRAICEEKNVPAPPMVLVTAHSHDDELRRVLHHTDGLLAKPVSARNLYEEIARCIGMEDAIRQRPGWRKSDELYWSRFHALDILLVEDMDINREVIGEMLTSVGLRFRLASNGMEALAQVKSRAPDLILMDCHMPLMDGFTATRHLRADPALAGIVVIALTASATAEDKRRCLAAGMNAFVTKPLYLENLYQQLILCMPGAQGGTGGVVAPADRQIRSAQRTEVLPELPGIDAALGLAQVGGRIPLFVRVLRKFRDNLGRNFAGQFSAALAAADWPAADRLIHSLKGVGKTLGASDLADTAFLLELAVGKRSLPDIAPLQELLLSQLQGVCAGLASLDEVSLPSVDGTPEPSAAEDAMPRLLRLAQMLEDSDAESAELAGALAPRMCASAWQAAWTPVASAVERYDFVASRAALQNLLAAMQDG